MVKKIKGLRARPAIGIFLLTYIGVLIYFLNQAHGFWAFVLAFPKALVWPAYLVNRIFTLLHIK